MGALRPCGASIDGSVHISLVEHIRALRVRLFASGSRAVCVRDTLCQASWQVVESWAPCATKQGSIDGSVRISLVEHNRALRVRRRRRVVRTSLGSREGAATQRAMGACARGLLYACFAHCAPCAALAPHVQQSMQSNPIALAHLSSPFSQFISKFTFE